MTAPRQVLPGVTYLVTRRCAQRELLLRPAEETNAIFLYVLALAARRFGVQVHAFCVLSNHFHLIVTDPGACLPAFEQYLGSLVARAVNCLLGRWESLWAPGSYSAVALLTPDDVVEKTAYVLANPVAAGLVQSGSEWPGLWSAPTVIGGAPIPAPRPATFFRETGYLPALEHLELSPPPGFASADDFRTRVLAALARHEELARGELARDGRSFLGRASVMAQSPFDRAGSGEARRQLKPRIASRDKWKRIEALKRLKAFLSAYREAWATRRAGRAALFPCGTYLLRVLHGVPCESWA
jgi:REP element-mobilizing transposase RayT